MRPTSQVAAAHAESVGALEDRLREAQRGAARLAERSRAAATAQAEAEAVRDEAAAQLENLRCVVFWGGAAAGPCWCVG